MIGRPEQLRIDVGDGLALHVTRAGTGPPLLLLHGFTGSADTWTPLRESLGDRYTTIAPDFAGHGRSDAPLDPSRYALSRFADDLVVILDTLGVQRAAVLGYSMGGRAALSFALAHGDRVAALVLESASPGITDPGERATRLESDADLAASIERDGVARFVARWERLPLWESQAALPSTVRTRLHTQRLRNHADGLANSLRGAGAAADVPVLGRLRGHTTPTLLIAGALDAKYVALAGLMESLMPRSHSAIVPAAGHATHLEHPAEFSKIVAHFLDTVAAETGQWR